MIALLFEVETSVVYDMRLATSGQSVVSVPTVVETSVVCDPATSDQNPIERSAIGDWYWSVVYISEEGGHLVVLSLSWPPC